MTESLTIAALAERVGMTVRNVRAYQSRGLLHAPEIRGRTAYYNSSHVARLGLISSLQTEGFTLAAIKRLVDNPDSYAAIVADRRRRFRDETSDIAPFVALPLDRLQGVEGLPDDLTRTGLVWEQDGQLVTHTLLMGVGRTLSAQGIPDQLLTRLQLDAAAVARELAGAFAGHVADDGSAHRVDDLAKVAVQLAAAAFEIAFLDTVRQHVDGQGDA